VPRSAAVSKKNVEESPRTLDCDVAFARAFYDYKTGKLQVRSVLTVGLQPLFYDCRLSAHVSSISDKRFGEIEKSHRSLRQELSFFSQLVRTQEQENFDEEIFVNLYGWLGALFAGLSLVPATEINMQDGEDLAAHCWRKLVAAIFIEQERYCWQLINIQKKSKSGTRSDIKSEQFMSVDEFRTELGSDLQEFTSWLNSYVSKHQSLIDCLNGIVGGRKFYWEMGCEFLKHSLEDKKFKSISASFPGVIIEYADDSKNQIKTDPPDPIATLNRLVYRPNSQELTANCKAVLEDSADVFTKLKLANWLRPFTKHVFAELGLSFMTKTKEHHRIKLELDHFLMNFVVLNSNGLKPPTVPRIQSAIAEFIDFKKKNPDDVQYFDRKGNRTKKSADFFYERMNSEANFRLEDHLQEIRSQAAIQNLLDKKMDTNRQMMIISVGRPDSKRGSVTTVVPLIQNIVAQGIGVEVCIGAYCYTEGSDANKTNEEISLVCYVETAKQIQYIENMANFFHQEIYIFVDERQMAYAVNLRDGKKREKGTWLETLPVNKNDLRPGDGYSLIDGRFYQTHRFTNESPLVHRHDFGLVSTRFGTFNLSDRQAKVIKYMYEYQNGQTEMKTSAVLDELKIYGDTIQRVFSHNNGGKWTIDTAWDRLLFSSRQGYIKLRL
jgi:hypothetical protein